MVRSAAAHSAVAARLDSDDEGFTLIELLVVIIIIGILAAIAIPVFLDQRQKAYDAAMKSDLNNLAQFEESYLVDHSGYASISSLGAAGYTVRPSPGVTLTVTITSNATQGYCLSASYPADPTAWYYDSLGGGLQPAGATGCPVVTSGTSGGSVTGP